MFCYTIYMEHFEMSNTQEDPLHAEYKGVIESFLGDAREYVSENDVVTVVEQAGLFEKTMYETNTTAPEKAVSYDKYKKSFLCDGKTVTKGAIVAARHLQQGITLPGGENLSFEEKGLQKIYREKRIEDFIGEKMNVLLAQNLAEHTFKKDMFVSKAYAKIAEREKEGNSEQLGVFAEKLMFSVAEMIAIDRPDLGLRISAANAYEDVHNKIDFIIASKQKRRGARIEAGELEPEYKSVGIQFTINTAKQAHKAEQIEKAKERGVHVDDIVYVALEGGMLVKALENWKHAGKPLSGPWEYLPEETRKRALQALFHSVLTEEQEVSLLKKI